MTPETHARTATHHQPQEPRGPGVRRENSEANVSDGVRLIGVARPTAQGLNEVVWDATTGCHCDRTHTKTVAREVSWGSGTYQNMPDPSGKGSTR